MDAVEKITSQVLMLKLLGGLDGLVFFNIAPTIAQMVQLFRGQETSGYSVG